VAEDDVTNPVKKTKKSLSSVPRFDSIKRGELHTEKIPKVLMRLWRFNYKWCFTLKFHPHRNDS